MTPRHGAEGERRGTRCEDREVATGTATWAAWAQVAATHWQAKLKITTCS